MSRRAKNILVMLVALSMTQGFLINPVFATDKGCLVKREKASAEYKKPLKLNISENGINRISFAPNIVTNIWGDSSEYSASLSASGSEVFLTSKLEAGNNIALAVSLAGGRIVDLILVTKKSEPQIINLNLRNKGTKQENIQREAQEMLKAMRQGVKGIYYIQEDSRQFNVQSHNLLWAKGDRLYQFGNLIGIPLLLKNKGKTVVTIDLVKFLSGFNDVVALQVDDLTLMPNMETKAYLVMARGIS